MPEPTTAYARLVAFTRAVEPVDGVAPSSRTDVWSESEAARLEMAPPGLAPPGQTRHHVPCAVCAGDAVEAGRDVQQHLTDAARRIHDHAG
eukprot:15145703-Alexandrium_andersonii.AAC.1